jgi:hypothetical protein
MTHPSEFQQNSTLQSHLFTAQFSVLEVWQNLNGGLLNLNGF